MSCNSSISTSKKDDYLDLRYSIPQTATIRIVGQNKDTRGKLFCNCRNHHCRFFAWLEPTSVAWINGRNEVTIPNVEEDVDLM